jgi:hypothetical protein
MWNSSNVINIPLLGQITTGDPSPIGSKDHPEYTIVQMLSVLHGPPAPHTRSNWAKCVAVSIQTVSDEFPIQATPNTQSNTMIHRQHIQTLLWLQRQKTSIIPSLQIAMLEERLSIDAKHPQSVPIQDSLELLRITIIDMMISYTILRARADDPVNPRKSTKRKNSDPANDELADFQSHHNFIPFILFLASGV